MTLKIFACCLLIIELATNPTSAADKVQSGKINRTDADLGTEDESKFKLDSEKKQYSVEVIIFEIADDKYLGSEAWPQRIIEVKDDDQIQDNTLDSALGNRLDNTQDKTIALSGINKTDTAPDEAVILYKNIPPIILLDPIKKISKSRAYNVLQHSAWVQIGLDSDNAIEIDLTDLDNHAKVKTENTITGTLKVVLARYLHFYTKLEYTRADEEAYVEEQATINMTIVHTDNPIEAALIESEDSSSSQIEDELDALEINEVLKINYYPIKSHRRMRSKELHYIDHPLVGILIQIDPVELNQ